MAQDRQTIRWATVASSFCRSRRLACASCSLSHRPMTSPMYLASSCGQRCVVHVTVGLSPLHSGPQDLEKHGERFRIAKGVMQKYFTLRFLNLFWGRVKRRSMDPRETARLLLRYRSVTTYVEEASQKHTWWRPDRRFDGKCNQPMHEKSVLFAFEAEKEATGRPWWKGKRYFHVYAYKGDEGVGTYASAVEYRTGANRDAECRGVFNIGLDQLQSFIEDLIRKGQDPMLKSFTFAVHERDQSVKLHNLRFQTNPYPWEGSHQTQEISLKVVRIFDETQKVVVSHAPFLLVGEIATALVKSPEDAAVKNVLLFNDPPSVQGFPEAPELSKLFERHVITFEKGETFNEQRFQTKEGYISYFTTSPLRTFSTMSLPQTGRIREVDAKERHVGVELADLIKERQDTKEHQMMSWGLQTKRSQDGGGRP